MGDDILINFNNASRDKVVEMFMPSTRSGDALAYARRAWAGQCGAMELDVCEGIRLWNMLRTMQKNLEFLSLDIESQRRSLAGELII